MRRLMRSKPSFPTETAVVDARFKDVLKGISEAHKDSLSSIRLTSYEPNRLVYERKTQETASPYSPRYTTPNGWQVTTDGKPTGLGRADSCTAHLVYSCRQAYRRDALRPPKACM